MLFMLVVFYVLYFKRQNFDFMQVYFDFRQGGLNFQQVGLDFTQVGKTTNSALAAALKAAANLDLKAISREAISKKNVLKRSKTT